MNFTTYINNRFQEIAVKQAKAPNQFSMIDDGETNALKSILWAYRFIMAVFLVPKVFTFYMLTSLKILGRPKPELDILKAQHDIGVNSRQRKLAKKVGMAPAPKLPPDYLDGAF